MIPAERAHLHIAAITHPGMSGKNNEDRYAVSAYRLEGDKPLPVVLAIISDGIGGHRAGEVAAEMVVETLSQAVAKSNAQNPVQTLREAIMRSSQEIMVQAESDPEKKGMGATCACALILDDSLYTAYVGDSRLYLMRAGAIHQISIDHTWVQEAIDAGIIEPEEGKGHPNAHVIRRYLGSKQPVEPDSRMRLSAGEDSAQSEANQGMRLLPGDQILLCSDGLTDLVNDQEIFSTLQQADQNQALQELVDLANQRGGHDNITIICLRVPLPLPETLIITPQPAATTLKARPARRKRALWALPVVGLLVLILIALIAAGAYYFYLRSVSPPAPPTAAALPTASQPAPLPSLDSGSSPVNPVEPTPLSPSEPASTPLQTTPAATLTPWPTNTQYP